MEFTKSLKTIKVTTRIGDEFTASDTLEKPTASNAYREFEKFGTMHILNDPKDFIPFHAVEMIEVSVASAEAEREDPYGCVGESVVCEAKACEASAEC